MRNVIFFIAVLLASCGTSHKLKQSQRKTMDSATVITRDSSRATKEISSGSNTTARDVHVRIQYAPLDSSMLAYMLNLAGAGFSGDTGGNIKTVPKTDPSTRKASMPAKTGNKVIDVIQDAISAAGGAGRIPSSIQIDIGSISDSSTLNVKKDSGGGHATSTTDLHKTEESKSKEVTHTGLPIGLKIGAGFLLLIILLVVVWRLWRKYKPL